MTNRVHAEFYDLGQLLGLRESLHNLSQDAPPKAVFVSPPCEEGSRRVGILSGSFNPPTVAHVELACCARELFRLDCVILSLSKVTVDKERMEGLVPEDRLLLLSLIAKELGWAAVTVVNRGLYFEQAQAFRSLLGYNTRISFIVGMDKLVQIFDPRYYRDREEALGILLSETQLLVAPRAGSGADDLERVLSRVENEPYRDRVFSLPLPAELRELSSSSLRSAIAQARPFEHQLPKIVSDFVCEAQAYRSSYVLRRRLLERLYLIRDSVVGKIDLARLFEEARENNERGADLRKLLDSGTAPIDYFREYVVSNYTR
jgi:nicotinic acid mononucleotide adenylyltransferase